MSDTMYKQLGTKWFTFYTKVRPWFACITALSVVVDFMQYQEVYTSYWWMMVYFLAALVQPMLCIIVFVKSQGDYEDFVHFVKGVLLFETINMAYGQAVQQYIQNEFDIGVALVVGVIILLLGYFIWYHLNMKYFKKRINVITNDYLPDDPNRITECKSCGYRDKNFFDSCPKCGKYAKRYVYLNDETENQTGNENVDADHWKCSCGRVHPKYMSSCVCGKSKSDSLKSETDKIRFCRKCGERLIDGSRFCNKCGTEVVEV